MRKESWTKILKRGKRKMRIERVGAGDMKKIPVYRWTKINFACFYCFLVFYPKMRKYF